MQFKVPQFLDIEDKIFGPFTFKEFIYLTGGAGLCFVLYKALGFWVGLIPIIITASLALSLTFYRPNGKPFVDLIEAGIKYMIQDKLFIWKRRVNKIKMEEKKDVNFNQDNNQVSSHKLDGSKLRDLSWSLDVLTLNKEQKKE
jgi:hypothetical protein